MTASDPKPTLEEASTTPLPARSLQKFLLVVCALLTACAARREVVEMKADSSPRITASPLLKSDAVDVRYIEIRGEVPEGFSLQVVTSFSNERPGYPFCTRYAFTSGPLGLSRPIRYSITPKQESFRFAAPLEYEKLELGDRLSVTCSPWYHAGTSINVQYLGKRAMLFDLGLIPTSAMAYYYKAQPLISPLEIVCSRARLLSDDEKTQRDACKTTLGPAYSWWFGLTDDFLSVLASPAADLSSTRRALELHVRLMD